MADENIVEGEEQKIGGLVKILPLVIMLIAIAIGVTLFVTDFFDSKPVGIDDKSKGVIHEQRVAVGGVAPNVPVALSIFVKEVAEGQAFDQLYNEMEHKFTVNLAGSKQICQFSMGFMTHYDQRVVDNVYKHEVALRSTIYMAVATFSKDQLATVADKQKLADKIKMRMNQVLIGYEDFGGIEEVFFTEFVIQ